MELNNEYDIKQVFSNKDAFIETLNNFTTVYYGKSAKETNNIQKYITLVKLINACSIKKWRQDKLATRKDQAKQVYYLSLEYQSEKPLKNNLLTLGIYDTVKEAFNELETNIEDIEKLETDICFGNTFQGVVAADLLESLTNHQYPGSVNTIRYRNGYYKQVIKNNEQKEIPDQWLKTENPWETRRDDKTIEVNLYGYVDTTIDNDGKKKYEQNNTEKILAVPYDTPVFANNLNYINTLRMWSAEVGDSLPEGKDYRDYIKDVEDICSSLYPNDTSEKGIEDRIKQQYFFVSASLQSIVNEHMKRYDSINTLPDKVAIQLNHTNVSLAIPELMRILIDQYHVDWKIAWDITTKVIVFAVNSASQDDFDKLPIYLMKNILPRIYLIIKEIDENFCSELLANGYDEEYANTVRIIYDDKIRMSSICLYGSEKILSISRYHLELLMDKTFINFYDLYPRRFINKTLGISHRKWFLNNNPELCAILDKYIGNEYRNNINKMDFFVDYVSKINVRKDYEEVKEYNKVQFAIWLKENMNIEIDKSSIYDVIPANITPNKRQLLTIFYILSIYFDIKDNKPPKNNTTFIFGGKADPTDAFSKKVIKLINCISDKINNDEEVNKYIRVIYLPNYTPSIEKALLPAVDIVEDTAAVNKDPGDISSIKFMMNGAVPLSTYGGLNEEIRRQVGDSCIFFFGLQFDEIDNVLRKKYKPFDIYKSNSLLKKAIDSLINGTWSDNKNDFKEIYDEFVFNNDSNLILFDFEDYVAAHNKIYSSYNNKDYWTQKCLVNVCRSTYFSSDRLAKEYASDIWKIKTFKKLTDNI